jgi:hypothetical protein
VLVVMHIYVSTYLPVFIYFFATFNSFFYHRIAVILTLSMPCMTWSWSISISGLNLLEPKGRRFSLIFCDCDFVQTSVSLSDTFLSLSGILSMTDTRVHFVSFLICCVCNFCVYINPFLSLLPVIWAFEYHIYNNKMFVKWQGIWWLVGS